MSIIDAVLPEFEEEAAKTRKYLERVPRDSFDWKPHPKSMSMIELASHLADNPGWAVPILEQPELKLDLENFVPYRASSREDLLAVFDRNVSRVKEALTGKADEEMLSSWRMLAGDRVVLELPRVAVLRTIILNHGVHHRGQLSVYLRMNDVPLPATYGPSADERM